MITPKEKLYWIWMGSIPGIGAVKFNKLIERFGSASLVFEAADNDILSCTSFIGEKTLQKILDQKNNKYLDYAYSVLMNKDIHVVTLLDDEYPAALKEIYDPPPVLYLKGRMIRQDNYFISIVGSRKASDYGLSMAEKLAWELSEAGVVIVSGLARGIDTMAHIGALKSKQGTTIGVLGCGVDVIYPPENKKLYQDIIERATLVSEYPLGTQPLSGNFPARNRIISGLSRSVLVIEAARRSGALITVDFALEQGRDVFALPGNINNPNSQGTNDMIKDGAIVVTSVKDILEHIGYSHYNTMNKRETPVIELDFFEAQVYNSLENGKKHLEEIHNITGMDIGRLSSTLTILEIKGIIKQLPGKIFIKQW